MEQIITTGLRIERGKRETCGKSAAVRVEMGKKRDMEANSTRILMYRREYIFYIN